MAVSSATRNMYGGVRSRDGKGSALIRRMMLLRNEARGDIVASESLSMRRDVGGEVMNGFGLIRIA